MDRGRFTIRPLVDADFEAVARLAAVTDPKHAGTPEEFRHWDRLLNLERGHLNLKVVAEDGATQAFLGWGSLAQPSFNFDPVRFWIWVAVFPEHRRQGVGAALFAHLVDEARGRKGVALWGNAMESDPAGVRFFASHGFPLTRKVWTSRLDVTQADLGSIPDRTAHLGKEGIRLSTLAAEGATSLEVRRRLHRLTELSGLDAPRMGGHHPASYEEFVALDLETPGAMPEGIFLALKGDDIVGMSSLMRDLARPDTLRVGYTGTHPEYRGRGIATELKRRSALLARDLGIRFLLTGNDSQNRRMLSINQRFGFRPETVWLQGELSLSSVP
jgi:mycothiol synthase